MTLAALTDYALEIVGRAPHLYALGALYWLLVVATLITRYALKRPAASRPLMIAVLSVGVVALVAAFVDTALRGQELVQVSLVAYFATPLGLGRYLIARWDGREPSPTRAVLLRACTFVTAFVVFVLLSVVDGDPWWFDAADIDTSSPQAVVDGTNWFHVMATIFGLVAVIDPVVTTLTAGRRARRVGA